MQYYSDKQIIIRDVQHDDAPFLFSWWIDRTLCKHDPRPLPVNTKTLQSECENYCRIFDTQIMNPVPEKNIYKYYIITNLENDPIGFINTFSYNEDMTDAELGIFIGDKSYWGKGIASRSLDYIVNMHFNEMGFNRIHVETGEGNEKSLKLFKNLGFTDCGEYLDEGFKFLVLEKIKKDTK